MHTFALASNARTHAEDRHYSRASAPLSITSIFPGICRVGMLLAERAPVDARILVLGAGGGLELKALAEAHPGWSFDGIDPSPDMLRLARQTVAAHAERIRLVEGYIDSAPDGPYDGATALLTFHFIPREQRLATLAHIHRRLKPGAAFLLAHISFPQTEPERSQWIARHVGYSAAPDADPGQLQQAREAIAGRLTIFAPEEEEDAATGRVHGCVAVLCRAQLPGLGRV